MVGRAAVLVGLVLVGATGCGGERGASTVTVTVVSPAPPAPAPPSPVELPTPTTTQPAEPAPAAAPAPLAPAAARPATARVAAVVDGDTLELADGRRVRLVQVDSPEQGECYGDRAGDVLRAMLPRGTAIRLERDPRLDDVDRYGRLLRTVFRGTTNVNLALVRRGAASVWFFEGERGRYAKQLLAAAKRARKQRQGLWRACPGTRLDPTGPVAARAAAPPPPAPAPAPAPPPAAASRCDPNYEGACVPIVDHDLDCADIGHQTVRVVGVDRHGFDGRDDDGWGCE